MHVQVNTVDHLCSCHLGAFKSCCNADGDTTWLIKPMILQFGFPAECIFPEITMLKAEVYNSVGGNPVCIYSKRCKHLFEPIYTLAPVINWPRVDLDY